MGMDTGEHGISGYGYGFHARIRRSGYGTNVRTLGPSEDPQIPNRAALPPFPHASLPQPIPCKGIAHPHAHNNQWMLWNPEQNQKLLYQQLDHPVHQLTCAKSILPVLELTAITVFHSYLYNSNHRPTTDPNSCVCPECEPSLSSQFSQKQRATVNLVRREDIEDGCSKWIRECLTIWDLK